VAHLLEDMEHNLKLHDYRISSFTGLLSEVARVKPDFILLEDDTPFTTSSLSTQLLTADCNLPVIVISGESNVVHILHKESILLNSSFDLINAIDHVLPKTETSITTQGDSLKL